MRFCQLLIGILLSAVTSVQAMELAELAKSDEQLVIAEVIRNYSQEDVSISEQDIWNLHQEPTVQGSSCEMSVTGYVAKPGYYGGTSTIQVWVCIEVDANGHRTARFDDFAEIGD